MFVHAVYFWLRPDLTAAEKGLFEESALAMAGIPNVRRLWLGKPDATDRPIIKRGYSYGLVVVFDDEAGQEAYQKHPIHDVFREKCGTFWEQVRIYDSL